MEKKCLKQHTKAVAFAAPAAKIAPFQQQHLGPTVSQCIDERAPAHPSTDDDEIKMLHDRRLPLTTTDYLLLRQLVQYIDEEVLAPHHALLHA